MKLYKSPFTPVVTLSNETAFTFLFPPSNNRKFATKKAIFETETGRSVTQQELHDQALLYADGLRTHANLKQGDVAVIFSPNSILYSVLLLACLAAGVTVSPANSAYVPDELAHQLKQSRASVILVGSDVVDVAKEAAKQVGLEEGCIYVMPNAAGEVAAGGALKSHEALKGKKGFEPVADLDLDSVCYLPFSSGTTSKPKGVMITHRNLTSVTQQIARINGLLDSPDDVVLGALPLSHMYGFMMLLFHTVHIGSTVAMMLKFDLLKFCDNIQKYKATVAMVVPPICIGLAKHPDIPKYDLSSLRFLMSGAAPLSDSLQQALQARLPSKTVVAQGYGMTETTCVALLPALDKLVAGTCGHLLSTMEARLVDENDNDVPEGEVGELLIRGPNILKGYLNNEEATKESITPDGFLRTGDVCQITRPGKDRSLEYYSVVDRRKELIKYKGFQVTPSELEAVLLTSPLVADSAVIGVWDEDQATELPRAYIVPTPESDAKTVSDQVAEYVKGKVAAHKRLRGGVFLLDVIPKSPTGKILRKELRAMVAKETKGKAQL